MYISIRGNLIRYIRKNLKHLIRISLLGKTKLAIKYDSRCIWEGLMQPMAGFINCLPVYQTASLPVCQSTRLPVYQNASLPDCQFTRLPVYQSASLPDYQSNRLPVYQSASLPDYQTTSLPV